MTRNAIHKGASDLLSPGKFLLCPPKQERRGVMCMAPSINGNPCNTGQAPVKRGTNLSQPKPRLVQPHLLHSPTGCVRQGNCTQSGNLLSRVRGQLWKQELTTLGKK